MSLTLCWWFTFLCLLQSVSAQATGTIHLFSSSSCEGSHMSCSNIPSNGCCTTDGLFASSYLVTFRGDSSLQVHARSFCEGVNKRTGPLTCFQPSFAFSAAKWFTTANSKRDEEASPDHANCWRPDLITLIDDDGQEVKIKVPNGMNTEFEQAFVKGNFTRLFKLARISPDLRFAFSAAGL